MPPCLSAREKRTLDAAAACIAPAGGPFPIGYADVDYQAFVTEYLSVVPKDVRLLLKVILFVVEYGALILAGRFGRFSRMPLEARNETLQAMSHSRLFFLRGFSILLSSLILMPFYRDQRVMDAIGYGGYKRGADKVPEVAP